MPPLHAFGLPVSNVIDPHFSPHLGWDYVIVMLLIKTHKHNDNDDTITLDKN